MGIQYKKNIISELGERLPVECGDTGYIVHLPTFRSISWVAQLGSSPWPCTWWWLWEGTETTGHYILLLFFTISTSSFGNLCLLKYQVAYERWWQQNLLSGVIILGFLY